MQDGAQAAALAERAAAQIDDDCIATRIARKAQTSIASRPGPTPSMIARIAGATKEKIEFDGVGMGAVEPEQEILVARIGDRAADQPSLALHWPDNIGVKSAAAGRSAADPVLRRRKLPWCQSSLSFGGGLHSALRHLLGLPAPVVTQHAAVQLQILIDLRRILGRP